jgi:hypothetical protein
VQRQLFDQRVPQLGIVIDNQDSPRGRHETPGVLPVGRK